jgi:hypothetical protein
MRLDSLDACGTKDRSQNYFPKNITQQCVEIQVMIFNLPQRQAMVET